MKLVMVWILSCVVAGMVAGIGPARAQANLQEVAGSWSGGGLMTTKEGPHERVRCKITYAPKKEGQSLRMDARCASDAYKMNLNVNIDQAGSTLSGNWFESEYRQGGQVSGHSSEGVIEAKVEGNTIVGFLTVRTKGNRQTFVMESPGAWISQVRIDLTRDTK